MLSNVIDIRDRVSEKLDGTITIKKWVVVFSLFVLLLIVSLSIFSPLLLRRVLRLNTNVIWLPDDPGNKQGWELHSVAQDERLFRIKCGELREGGVIPQNQTPRPRRRRGANR